MVTRARKSSEASESPGEAWEEAEMEGGTWEFNLGVNLGGTLFFTPLSSFPLGQFALSSPAELRLD